MVQFEVRWLIKLMKAYCESLGLSRMQIRFQFDGQPVDETDIPALEIEEDVMPGMFQQQTGGVY